MKVDHVPVGRPTRTNLDLASSFKGNCRLQEPPLLLKNSRSKRSPVTLNLVL